MTDKVRPELKDVVVVVPWFASTVAISWEAGVSLMNGGFHFFSLSEHLGAAVSALPLALLAATAIVFITAAARNIFGQEGISYNAQKLVCALGFVLGVGIVALSIYLPSLFIFTIGASMALASLVLGAVNRSAAASLMLYATLAAAVPFSAGAELQRSYLAIPDKPLDTIKLKSGPINGVVAMAGERGVLIYRPETKTFLFARADELISVEYRAPFSEKN